jgi:hypothetical protein
VVTPDRTQTLPPPGACSGCGGDLADAADEGAGSGPRPYPRCGQRRHARVTPK